MIPIANTDGELAKETVPHWLRLPAEEILLCVDHPEDQELASVLTGITKDPRLRILEGPKDRWPFYQAQIRRHGFRNAKCDLILTGDVDDIPNSHVLDALALANGGRDNIGMVHLQKNIRGKIWRNFTRRAMRSTRRTAYYTGLYAIWRPYWLDTEDQALMARLPHPEKIPAISRRQWAEDPLYRPFHLNSDAVRDFPGFLGEDVAIRRAMLHKHKTATLPIVGAEEIRAETGNRKRNQIQLGRIYYVNGKPLRWVLISALLHERWPMFVTYARLRFGGPQS